MSLEKNLIDTVSLMSYVISDINLEKDKAENALFSESAKIDGFSMKIKRLEKELDEWKAKAQDSEDKRELLLHALDELKKELEKKNV